MTSPNLNLKQVITQTIVTFGTVILALIAFSYILSRCDRPFGIVGIPIVTEGQSGVTATELTTTIVEILAEINPAANDNGLAFSSAELTISAKQAFNFTGGAEGKAFVVKLEGEVASDNETSVEVSYELKDQIQAIIEIQKFRPTPISFINDSLKLDPLLKKFPNAWELKKRVRPLPAQQVKGVLDSAQKVVKKRQEAIRRDYFNEQDIRNALITAIQEGIRENQNIKEHFNATCLSVEISFTIGKKQQGKVTIDILEASVSGSVTESREGTHTLKLSFGKC